MKHIFVILLAFLTLSTAAGQKHVSLPPDGNWPVIYDDSLMIIGPKVDELTEEQRYFNPIYLMVYPGKEHLKQQIIRGCPCECDTTVPNRRIGIFSVAPDKQVSFSQGNLQYFPAADLWKFAENQYDYCGNANKYLSPTFRNWVDLFGWSVDDAGDFVDWGTNDICGDEPGTWRTLSKEEWKYLMHDRVNATSLLSYGYINNIKGLILLPDSWKPSQEIVFTSLKDLNIQWASSTHPNSYIHTIDDIATINQYSLEQWQILEKQGAVFLPASGYIQNTLQRLGDIGRYWSSSPHPTVTAYYMSFGTTIHTQSMYNKNNAIAVRLVHDTILPPPAPCMVVKINDTVSINMMCVEGGTFMMGASDDDSQAEADERPQHQVTLSDYYIGQTEVTQQLWEAVMENNPSKFKGSYLPVESVSWEDCQVFVQKLSEMTGLKFRLPTEAEWEYAARGGQWSKGYPYAGSDNLDEVAWYTENANNQTHTIAGKQPNELGIFDMTGNVWEFCQDWYGSYSAEAQTDPQGVATGEKRVLRGGCYHYDAANCSNTNRHRYYTPNKGGASTGLRLVLEMG